MRNYQTPKSQWTVKKLQNAQKNHEFIYVGGKSGGSNMRKKTGAEHHWRREGDINPSESMVFCPRRICGTAEAIKQALETELIPEEVEDALENSITKYNVSTPRFYDMFVSKIQDYVTWMKERQIQH